MRVGIPAPALGSPPRALGRSPSPMSMPPVPKKEEKQGPKKKKAKKKKGQKKISTHIQLWLPKLNECALCNTDCGFTLVLLERKNQTVVEVRMYVKIMYHKLRIGKLSLEACGREHLVVNEQKL